jgi:MoxR-like ATPase
VGPAAAEIERLQAACEAVQRNVGRVLVGKEGVLDHVLVALLAEGHVLLEDVPGIGKTTLAKALARSLDLSFSRIQFTPDLLPSDVTGLYYFDQRSSEFLFRPGPIHAQVVLADEINRATPRTQSAVLEAMEERQVTVEGRTLPLPRPFIVLATQNPVELEGTFPLPEAQLDRFFLRLALGYPTEAEEREILARRRGPDPLDDLQPVLSAEELRGFIRLVAGLHVDPSVQAYVVAIASATRRHEAIELGASPRATLALQRASQALAALRGRPYVLPDDVKAIAPAVLAHRLILRHQPRLHGRSAEQLVRDLLATIPAPTEAPAGAAGRP